MSNMAHDEDLRPVDTQFEAIRKTQTMDSVVLPRDVFEKLYLNPKTTPSEGSLRKKVGNPTPIALIGFLVASTPHAFITMGWRGAGGHGAAIIPVFIFFGGMVQVLASIGEWLIGNTFACAIFFTYGTFWLVSGAGQMPFFATGLPYSETGSNMDGQSTPQYYATYGFYYVCLCMITTVYTICALRTNLVLFSALLLLVVTFGLFAGSYFENALGNTDLGGSLGKIAGGFILAICILVWYLFIVQMLEGVDFPVTLPVGDLTNIVPAKSSKARRKANDLENGE